MRNGMSDWPFDSLPRDGDRVRFRISFEVGMALVALVLCLLYALLFSRMVYDSVVEHFVVPSRLLRYMGPPHVHHPLEWVWLLSGLVFGWGGTFASARYLARRSLQR